MLLTLAKKLVEPHIPPLTQDQEERAILKGLQLMAAEGVTSVHEAGISRKRLPAWENLARQGRLPIRVYGLLDGNDAELVANWVKRGPFDSDFFTVRGFKVYYDGSLGSRTALLAGPYSDRPHEAEMTERISIEAIRKLAEQVSPQGFQLAVHTIGDAANHKIIDLYRVLRRKFPARDLRWRLEHAQVLDAKAIREISQLGLIASMQPSHAVGLARCQGAADAQLRLARRALDTQGNPLFCCDAKDPLWAAASRLVSSAGFNRAGSPDFTIPSAQLKDIKVIETWVDGRLVKPFTGS